MTFIVEGIPTRDSKGNPYIRQDIDKWYADQVEAKKGDRIQLTLFVEALALMQKRPLDNQLSYFRLAAIHSAPWCKWDDVPQPPVLDPKGIAGYCVHNNYTFPTWHRVYMLLYERALYEAMDDWIKGNVPKKLQPDWKGKADKWRLPYWDFARFADRDESTNGAFVNDIDHDRIRLPILCMLPNVRINVFGTDGKLSIESRPNPLYKYVTPKLMGEFPAPYTIPKETSPKQADDHDSVEFKFPWDMCNATTKYGLLDGFNEEIWADGGQNWFRANYALNEHPYYKSPDPGETTVPTLQELVHRLFQSGLDSWGEFSSTRYTDKEVGPYPPKGVDPKSAINAKNAMNLEFIHNNVHNFVGGSQFLRPPKEGINLWGAGHMSSVNMAAFDPIFYIFHNNIDRLTAIWQALNPKKWFDDDYSKLTVNNDLLPFHKDAAGNFWKSDDVQDWRTLGYDFEILQGRTSDDRDEILEDIDKLYGLPTRDLFDKLPDVNGHQDDYVITVVYDKYALNGAAYKINLFLDGQHDFKGPESEGFVASVYNFSADLDSGPCGNCHRQKEENVRCIAQVPVTAPMRRHLGKNKSHNIEIDAPQPVYMAWNSWGRPVRLPIHVALHRSSRLYYKYPNAPNPQDPLRYKFIKLGKQAPESSFAFAATSSR
ncbi:Di-copper centre-containing protein [Aspergillus campestris IBT 28561]|uniref:tyrosinase n=1 Tax=Aspergillus campestris (strain IBT 28561) TaxID=1392248 RepID=A0A2I1CR74_ASPC2|nr:Di-copper centre-containing protein [Aspergillus campestris IBT 28561]PKY00109.1 Di-copper centre-containing protein [Aspergillus campestris IBT 28561]